VHVGRLVGAVAGLALIGAATFVAVKRETIVPLLRSSLPHQEPQTPPAPTADRPAELAIESSSQTPHPIEPVTEERRPEPQPPPAPAAPAPRPLYQFTDNAGVVHITDDLATVPARYRSSVTTP
jgi:hypothetical protein